MKTWSPIAAGERAMSSSISWLNHYIGPWTRTGSQFLLLGLPGKGRAGILKRLRAESKLEVGVWLASIEQGWQAFGQQGWELRLRTGLRAVQGSWQQCNWDEGRSTQGKSGWERLRDPAEARLRTQQINWGHGGRPWGAMVKSVGFSFMWKTWI